VGEEALGIALWIALATDDFLDGVSAAVTHSGDSDSTGAIAGNILGAALGERAIPPELLDGLAERRIVAQVADDVHALLGPRRPEVTDEVLERYPEA
jgi:ADP-ribosylglycohydrolase